MGVYNLLSTLSILSIKIFATGVILMLVISIATVTVSYCLIYRVVRKLHQPILSIERAKEETWSRQRNEHHQMAKTFAITIGVFLLCYIPTLIVFIIQAVTGSSTDVVYIGLAWSDMFAFINSSLNPIIYCYRIREIREALMDTIFVKSHNGERRFRKQLKAQYEQGQGHTMRFVGRDSIQPC